MNFFPNGKWQIESVLLNRETVMNNEGFRMLEVIDDELIVQPAEIRFTVKQMDIEKGTAVFASRNQTFFAEMSCNSNSICIELTRPKFHESVQIEASLAVVPESSMLESVS